MVRGQRKDLLCHRALMDDRPRYSKAITQLAKASRKERLFKRHVDLSILGEKLVYPLSLFRGVHRQVDIDAPDFLKHRWRNIISDQHRISNTQPRMNNRLPCITRRVAARSLILTHHHEDLAAKVLFVEAKRLFAISTEIELCIEFHRDL